MCVKYVHTFCSTPPSWEAHVAGSPTQEGEHVQTVKSGQTQKDLIDALEVWVLNVVQAENVVGNVADDHDQGKQEALQLSPKVLLKGAPLLIPPV